MPLSARSIWNQFYSSLGRMDNTPPRQRMNIPPLVNERPQRITPFFQKRRGLLTSASVVGYLIASACFSIGSIIGYCIRYDVFTNDACFVVTCTLIKKVLAVIGSLMLIIAPTATFILCDAISFRDLALSLNISLYIASGVAFLIGALLLTMSTYGELLMMLCGASAYVFGSVLIISAVGFDMIRVHKLGRKMQISVRTFTIEMCASGLYMLGSLLFLAGSLLSFPKLYSIHVNGVFLCGSCAYSGGTLYAYVALLWRFEKKKNSMYSILFSGNALNDIIWNISATEISRSYSPIPRLKRSFSGPL